MTLYPISMIVYGRKSGLGMRVAVDLVHVRSLRIFGYCEEGFK